MRRRFLAAASLAALALSACGQVESPPGGPEPNVHEEGTATADPLAVECDEPPAPPVEVPTFTPDDAPTGADLSSDASDEDADDDAADDEETTAEAPGVETVSATVTTNCGDLVIDLDAGSSPVTVASFEQLAQTGYWDDSACHRLTTDGIFVLQCGDPTGTGSGGPGYSFGVEAYPLDGFYPRGSIAMARAQSLDSNGGQFFIVYQDTTLGAPYTLFGQVTEGLEIVDHIADAGTDSGRSDGSPAEPISILSVAIED